MTRGVADTSVFIATESGRPLATADLPDEIAISIITIGELRAGVLAASDLDTRDRRLSTLTHALSLSPLPIDELVAEAWARLRVTLRDRNLKMPVNDSWLAATAMAHGLPIVTQDA
ncbi:MAG TPA: type II toxin-antitoxin system VapC family toxin, partial [Ilumatobacteraceae bacterium]